MPIPNGFLRKEELSRKEDKFELACYYCRDCGLVQLTTVVSPLLMFKNYVYIPSGAKVMMNNFSNLSYQMYKELKLKDSSLVVDVGSNDGSLLAFFKNLGMRVLGVDPAKNLAVVARARGIPTESRLFNVRNALVIRKKYGSADLICATNVVAHIDDLHNLMEAVSVLLSERGAFVTEFPYLFDLIKKNEFDTIYHEHLSFFSLKPWMRLINPYGFELVSAQKLLVHGGSIRLVNKRKTSKSKINTKNIRYLIDLEERFGLYSEKTYEQFATEVNGLRVELVDLLKNLKAKKKRIVGIGAAAKGNVLTNFFRINSRILDYISDSTSYKQGLFTPGMHIPVVGEQKLMDDNVDYALILAWNFADEIMEKFKSFHKKGGKFIIPVPKVEII